MGVADFLNNSSSEAAELALARCCGAGNWVRGMMQRKPFADDGQVHHSAVEVWQGLKDQDFLEAFTHHPQIGSDPVELRRKFQRTSNWSSNEQSGMQMATEDTIQALAKANRDYLEKFGYIFIVCASGKSADEMLEILLRRLPNEPSRELLIAAGEQQKITALRLEKLTS